MRDEEAEKLAGELDLSYRKFIGARAMAKNAILQLLRATVELARVVSLARGSVRGSFARWCRVHCQAFDPNAARAVALVAERTQPEENRVETWQLRALDIITPIHHSARPMAQNRKAKSASWLGSLVSSREKIQKLVEQSGGEDQMDPATRAVITRQLGMFDKLRDRLSKPTNPNQL